MNKEKFIKMLEQAKEDEYGRLYVIGNYDNKIYFGTITTICEDIFVLNHSEECQNTAELYDRHFWNDDTLECYVVSTKHDEDIIYKEPKRIEEIKMIGCNMEVNLLENKTLLPIENLQTEFIISKINELVRISNKYARLLEKAESDEQMTVFDMAGDEFTSLLKENQELKNQLEEHKNIYIKKVNNFLAENVEPDSEDLYMAELEQRAMDCELMEMQQKEFIKYLEGQIKTSTEVIRLIYKNILQQYKETIGDAR